MSTIKINSAKAWQSRHELSDFNPKFIFEKDLTIKEVLFSLGFFLSVMSIETLFNQPFQRKIKIFHNQIFKKIFRIKYEKVERVEINSFAFSFFLILQKVFE